MVPRRHDVHRTCFIIGAVKRSERGRWWRIAVPARCSDAFGAAGGRAVEIEFAGNVRVRGDASVDEAALGRVLRALGR